MLSPIFIRPALDRSSPATRNLNRHKSNEEVIGNLPAAPTIMNSPISPTPGAERALLSPRSREKSDLVFKFWNFTVDDLQSIVFGGLDGILTTFAIVAATVGLWWKISENLLSLISYSPRRCQLWREWNSLYHRNHGNKQQNWRCSQYGSQRLVEVRNPSAVEWCSFAWAIHGVGDEKMLQFMWS